MKGWEIMWLIDVFILFPLFFWVCFGDNKKKKK